MIIQKPHHVLCPHCDLLTELTDIAIRHKAVCPRCHTTLAKNHTHMKQYSTVYALCALIMLLLTCGFVFINIRLLGTLNNVSILDIPSILYSDNYSSICFLFMLFVLIFPALNLIIISLLCTNIPLSTPLKRDLLIVYQKLEHWCMSEIFLAGILVSFVKLMSYGDIGITKAFLPFCLFVFFKIKTAIIFSPNVIWNELATNDYSTEPLQVGKTGISQNLRLCLCCHAILPLTQSRCSRCQKKGKARERDKIQWTISLLVTSLIIYVPANIFGIMITVVFGSASSSTIMDGVIFMWQSGDIPVALVIFIASVAIPILKIISLSRLCYFSIATKRKNKYDCLKMNKLYNAVEFIGKWSMIDIFVVAVVCSLVRNQQIMGIYPDIGIIFFASVVVITMVASQKFDPRLIWDKVHI